MFSNIITPLTRSQPTKHDFYWKHSGHTYLHGWVSGSSGIHPHFILSFSLAPQLPWFLIRRQFKPGPDPIRKNPVQNYTTLVSSAMIGWRNWAANQSTQNQHWLVFCWIGPWNPLQSLFITPPRLWTQEQKMLQSILCYNFFLFFLVFQCWTFRLLCVINLLNFLNTTGTMACSR